MRRRSLIALLLVAAQTAAVGVGAYVYAWYTNSLEGSGRWLATKRHLELRVMGSAAFAGSHHTLSGQRLDLGRWFGFQEVLLAEPVAARSVAFDFRPEPGGYLAFLHAVGPERSEGMRLSTDARFPSGRFTIDADGGFLEFERVPELDAAPGAWSHVAVDYGPDGVLATLGNSAPVRIGSSAGSQRIGFRSGSRPVLVDDVHVETAGVGGFHESFFNAAGFRRGLLALVLVAAIDLALWSRLRRRESIAGRPIALALGGAAALLAAAAGVWLLQRAWAGRYPRLDRDAEAAWVEREIEDITGRITQRYGWKAPGSTRVLVVGTSQTWGAGAARAEDGFVETLERLLAAAEPERRWECVNAGISGTRAAGLLEVFRSRLLALEPDVLVVNLSFNDKDPAAFAEALHGFARLAEEGGIATLFVLEAMSLEAAPEELRTHAVMRRVAEEHGIRVVDAYRALAQQFDRGFLWWDPVHPTSFGHRLIAEALAPAVRELAHSP